MCSLIEVLSATLVPLIGIAVAYVAYQQWQTNHRRLRHELYDRRFKIYKTVQIYLSHIFRDAKVNEETEPALFDAKQQSRFLMGPEIEEYLDEVLQRSSKVTMYQKMREGARDREEHSQLVQKEHDELKWLNGQINTLNDCFSPYLSLAESESFVRRAIRRFRS